MLFNLNLILNDAPQPWQIGFQDSAAPGFSGIVELHNTLFFYLIVVVVGIFWVLTFNDEYSYVNYNVNETENNNSIFNSTLKMENNNATTGDIDLLINTEKWLKEEAIAKLNNSNLSFKRAESIISDIVEALTDYHNAGGNLNSIPLYSLIENKYYFKLIKEEVQDNTDQILEEGLNDDSDLEESNSNDGSKGSGGLGPGSGSGLLLGPDNSSPENSSNSSNVNKFIVLLFSLFSYIVDFIIEHLDSFTNLF